MRTMTTRSVICCLFAATLSLGLGGCLPGKEKTAQVFEQTEEAVKTVAAEKAAADLAGIAQQLLASDTLAPSVTNPQLHTLRCADGRVVSYIPRTASVARSGTLPENLARRVRTDLEKRFKSDFVKNASEVSADCNLDPELVAVNSPILELDTSFAGIVRDGQSNTTPTDVASIEVEPCTNGPGVRIVRRAPDRSVISTEDRCSSAIAPNVPELQLGSTSVPNWRRQLTGETGAMENFTCIATTAGCNPVDPREFGKTITCDEDNEPAELMVNASYDKTTADFKPNPAVNMSCGRGWGGTVRFGLDGKRFDATTGLETTGTGGAVNGKMIARIDRKRCKVKRGGTQQAEPATVINVAWVGAQCAKNDAHIPETCPGGYPLSGIGRVLTTGDVGLNSFLAMQPTKVAGTNVSRIGYLNNALGSTVTNLSSTTRGVINQPLTVTGLASSASLFPALTDLSSVQDEIFDHTFVPEMRSLGKMSTPTDPRCYTMGQDCNLGLEPNVIDITVDRSNTMGERADTDIYTSTTYCEASMANLFQPSRRDMACKAAAGYAAIARNRDLRGYIDHHRDSSRDPILEYNRLLLAAEFDALAVNGMPTDVYNKMRSYRQLAVASLTNPAYRERLLFALASGYDCSVGRSALSLGSFTFNFNTSRNVYGSCAPEFIDQSRLGSFANNGNLKTCQSTCPGTCVTEPGSRLSNGMPRPVRSVTKMEAIDLYIKNYLVPRLPVKSRTDYTEFMNNSLGSTVNLFDNRNMPIDEAVAVDPSYYAKKAQQKMQQVANNREDETGGGTALIFKSIDEAIDRLMATQGSNRTKPAHLIIFGSKYDNHCTERRRDVQWWQIVFFPAFLPGLILSSSMSLAMTGSASRAIDAYFGDKDCVAHYHSPRFGRNFCQPEAPPKSYECDACIGIWELGVCSPRPEWDSCAFKILGSCVGAPTTVRRATARFTPDDVKNHPGNNGIDDWGGRMRYCKAQKSWGRNLDRDLSIHVTSRWHSNRESHDAGIVTPDNHDSLVGWIGRNFPNTKIYYFDADGEGYSKMCLTNKDAYIAARDKTMAHGFYRNNQILYIYSNSDTNQMAKDLKTFVDLSTGGFPTEEAGEQVCKSKFGSAVNLIRGVPDRPMPHTVTFDSMGASTMTCTAAILDVKSTKPDDMPELPAAIDWQPPPPPIDQPGDGGPGDGGPIGGGC